MDIGMNASDARSWPFQLVVNSERRHRALIILSVMVSIVLIMAMAFYGWNYYILDQAHRPFSGKHAQLKPSGTVGLKLGMLGLFLFVLVYLYPLRKRWLWLARKGKAKHWLDFHMLLGLVAPVVVSYHSAFKIQGFAGMAYWTMVALVISGLVGRYFYAQIPRTLNAMTMTLKDTQELSAQLVKALSAQEIFDPSEVAQLFRLPDEEQVRKMSVVKALFRMVVWDVARPVKVWSLRRRKESPWGKVLTLGGILPTHYVELERAISVVARHASLSKKVLFLSKTERVFYLWHVVHRPFGLSFAIFVILHIVVVMSLGYF